MNQPARFALVHVHVFCNHWLCMRRKLEVKRLKQDPCIWSRILDDIITVEHAPFSYQCQTHSIAKVVTDSHLRSDQKTSARVQYLKERKKKIKISVRASRSKGIMSISQAAVWYLPSFEPPNFSAFALLATLRIVVSTRSVDSLLISPFAVHPPPPSSSVIVLAFASSPLPTLSPRRDNRLQSLYQPPAEPYYRCPRCLRSP